LVGDAPLLPLRRVTVDFLVVGRPLRFAPAAFPPFLAAAREGDFLRAGAFFFAFVRARPRPAFIGVRRTAARGIVDRSGASAGSSNPFSAAPEGIHSSTASEPPPASAPPRPSTVSSAVVALPAAVLSSSMAMPMVAWGKEWETSRNRRRRVPRKLSGKPRDYPSIARNSPSSITRMPSAFASSSLPPASSPART
jgi:hypothetical protein